MSIQDGKEKAREYYNQEAPEYIKQYQDNYEPYPANLIRINFIADRLKLNNVKTILDAGCGTCGPMIRLLKEGFDVNGFDFSQDMVDKGKEELTKEGIYTGRIQQADLEKDLSIFDEEFDAAIALGVFPHIVDEKLALSNMRSVLNPGGRVFIEFRNELFSTYTFNKHSCNFFLNKLVGLGCLKLQEDIHNDITDFFSMASFASQEDKQKDGKISYSNILAKFHNPLTISEELFKPCGFNVIKTHFYHYHALPPFFQNKYPKLFRELSLKMEKTDDWRGHFMASAFVIEAQKPE